MFFVNLRVFLSNVVCVVGLFIIDCPFDFLWRLVIMSMIVGIRDYKGIAPALVTTICLGLIQCFVRNRSLSLHTNIEFQI